jgi:hypothetical protein
MRYNLPASYLGAATRWGASFCGASDRMAGLAELACDVECEEQDRLSDHE